MNCLDRLQSRSLLVLGLGREGLSTLAFLRRRFPGKPLAVADRQPLAQLDEATRQVIEADPNVQAFFGPDYMEHARDYEVICKSPGVYPSELAGFVAEGQELTSNAALFFECCPGSIVGVTGTKGKSTTTSVIYSVLTRGSGDVRLTGNIGIAPLSSLDGATEATTFVAELSSYQLMYVRRSPHIAVLQNIVPEHLDYHGSFDSYVDSKRNITRYQAPADYLLYNADYPLPLQIAQESKACSLPFAFERHGATGCFLEDNWLTVNLGGRGERIVRAADVPLKGRFNLLNVMPGVLVGRIMGVPPAEIAEAIRAFKPLEHRLEYAGTVKGVQYYNDSLATVPEATAGAMEAFPGSRFILMLGGFDRGLDYAPLAQAILSNNVRAMLLFPTTGERIWDTLLAAAGLNSALPEHHFVTTMHEAVEYAATLAQPGDIVLLSPAAPSFGTFKDYRDRGNQFKAEVGEEGARG